MKLSHGNVAVVLLAIYKDQFKVTYVREGGVVGQKLEGLGHCRELVGRRISAT
jgi:hypothetical protein